MDHGCESSSPVSLGTCEFTTRSPMYLIICRVTMDGRDLNLVEIS